MLRLVYPLLFAWACACTPSSVEVSGKDATTGPPDTALPFDAIQPGDAGPEDRTGLDIIASDRQAGDLAVGSDRAPALGPDFDETYNFQPPGEAPSGTVADTGEMFTTTRGYGWTADLTQSTERVDLLSDKRLDTYIEAGATGRVDYWELQLEPAQYLITVVAGKPEMATGPMRVVAEGEVIIGIDATLTNSFIWAVDREITVGDGQLTLEVGTGTGPTALNFIRVRSANPPPSGCAERTEICNGEDDDCDTGIDEETVCLNAPVVCYGTTLESGADVANNGFMQRGGLFSEGGFLVAGQGTRVERTLQGNFYRGTITFEAKDLYWQMPLESGATTCARTVFDFNHATPQDPARTRFFLASVAPGCGGQPGGVLRLTQHSSFCCLDSPALPASNDGAWHSYQITWDESSVTLFVDNSAVASGASTGASVGRDPVLWFGSSGGSGDATQAVFKNLEICNEVQ